MNVNFTIEVEIGDVEVRGPKIKSYENLSEIEDKVTAKVSRKFTKSLKQLKCKFTEPDFTVTEFNEDGDYVCSGAFDISFNNSHIELIGSCMSKAAVQVIEKEIMKEVEKKMGVVENEYSCASFSYKITDWEILS